MPRTPTQALTDDERRYLEYFWSPKHKSIRNKLPLSVIVFLHNEDTRNAQARSAAAVQAKLVGFSQKGYITQAGGGIYGDSTYTLSVQGMAHLKDRHPTLFVLWDQTVERTPRIIQFLVAAIGLVSAALGIIEFVR